MKRPQCIPSFKNQSNFCHGAVVAVVVVEVEVEREVEVEVEVEATDLYLNWNFAPKQNVMVTHGLQMQPRKATDLYLNWSFAPKQKKLWWHMDTKSPTTGSPPKGGAHTP